MRKFLKFYKNDCPPCYGLSRLLVQIEIPKDIEIESVNVGEEKNKVFAKSLGIDKVPTIMNPDGAFLSGKITKEELLKFLQGEA